MRLILALLLSGICGFATVISGTIKSGSGAGMSGTLTLTLAQQGALLSSGGCGGPALIVPYPVSVKVVNGVLQSSLNVYGNDCMLPSGTYYSVKFVDGNANTIFTDRWLISGSSMDIGSVVSVQVNGTTAVLGAPGVIFTKPTTTQQVTQPSGTALAPNNLSVTQNFVAPNGATCTASGCTGFAGSGAGTAIFREAVGPISGMQINIAALGLTSDVLNALAVQCWSGTGMSGGHVTGTLTPLKQGSYPGVTLDSRTTSSVTANFDMASNVVCVASNGGKGEQGLAGTAGASGPTGPVGPTGPQGLQGLTGPQGVPGAVGPPGVQGAAGPTGPAAWKPVVVYNGSTLYGPGPPADVVAYGGSTYVCKASSFGVAPNTDANKWALVAQKGADGSGGGAANFPDTQNLIKGIGSGQAAAATPGVDYVLPNDDRLSDARTPTAHADSHKAGQSDPLTAVDIGAVASNDSRLTNSRTPLPHANSHAIGQADAVTPAAIGAAPVDDPRLENARVPVPPTSATLGGMKSGQCTTATQKLMGYDNNGDRICETDQTGTGGGGGETPFETDITGTSITLSLATHAKGLYPEMQVFSGGVQIPVQYAAPGGNISVTGLPTATYHVKVTEGLATGTPYEHDYTGVTSISVAAVIHGKGLYPKVLLFSSGLWLPIQPSLSGGDISITGLPSGDYHLKVL